MGPAYIPLIVLASWRLGPLAGCAVAAIAAVLTILPALPGETGLPPAVTAARALLRLGTYAFVVAVTCALGRAYGRERNAARRDALTGAMNRPAFEEHARTALATRGRGSLVVAVADLDGFKAVNDGEGHAAGDEALRGFTAAARSALHGSERIARLGGDEFIFLLEANTDETTRPRVEVVRERLVQELARHGVGVSMGAVVLPPGADADLSAACRAADALMYAAKTAGKGGLRIGTAPSLASTGPELGVAILAVA